MKILYITIPFLVVASMIITGCGEDESGSSIYINEIEKISVGLGDESGKVTLTENIGVGMNGEENINLDTPVILRDQIPSEFTVTYPKVGCTKIQTVNSEYVNQTFSMNRMGNMQTLSFDLDDDPSTDDTSIDDGSNMNGTNTGTMTGMGNTSGMGMGMGMCCMGTSMQVTYQATDDTSGTIDNSTMDRGVMKQWATISYQSEPKELALGKNNAVNVTVNVENHSLKSPILAIVVPRQINGAQVGIVTVPKGFTKKDYSGYMILEKAIVDSQKIVIPLVIKPGENGQLRLSDSIQVYGSLEELVYPMVEVVDRNKVERENISIVNYHGSLTFQVR